MNDPKALLTLVGAFFKARAQRAFVEQRRGRAKWQARRVPNVAGVLADLVAGRTPPQRRFEPRPALIDTSALRRSIAFRVLRRDTVEIGSALPYADLMQRGGTSLSPVITEDLQQRLWKWLKPKAKKGVTVKNKATGVTSRVEGSDLRVAFGWLLNKKQRGKRVTFKIPSRPFITIEPEDRADLLTDLGVEVVRIVEQAP
jgi:phage gpG-like protein